MGIALSTAGVTVGYATETTAGTRPTTGFKLIPDIKEVPEMNPEPESLETTTLAATEFKTYTEGLKDLGPTILGVCVCWAKCLVWKCPSESNLSTFPCCFQQRC